MALIPGSVHICRPDEGFNLLRAYQLYIDQKHVGFLKRGESLRFTLSPGTHQIKARIDWCVTELAVQVHDGQEVRLEVSQNRRGFFLGALLSPLIGLSKGRYLSLRQVEVRSL